MRDDGEDPAAEQPRARAASAGRRPRTQRGWRSSNPPRARTVRPASLSAGYARRSGESYAHSGIETGERVPRASRITGTRRDGGAIRGVRLRHATRVRRTTPGAATSPARGAVGEDWSMPILITADELARRLDAERDGRAASRTVVLDVRWSLGRARRHATRTAAGHIPGRRLRRPRCRARRPRRRPGRGGIRCRPRPALHRGDAPLGPARRRHGRRDATTSATSRPRGPGGCSGTPGRRRAHARRRPRAHGGRRGIRSRPATSCLEPGDATAHFGAMPVLDIDGAAAFPATGVLLDARAAPRYRGEVEPIDPRAGHIPGARSAPSAGNLDADGRFLLGRRAARALRGRRRRARHAGRRVLRIGRHRRARGRRARARRDRRARSTPARGASGRTRRAGRSPPEASPADDVTTRGGGPPR